MAGESVTGDEEGGGSAEHPEGSNAASASSAETEARACSFDIKTFLRGGMGSASGWKLYDVGHSSPVFVGAPAGDAAYLGHSLNPQFNPATIMSRFGNDANPSGIPGQLPHLSWPWLLPGPP